MDQIISSYLDVWVNWKNFSGRTRRSAFWYAILVSSLISIVLGVLTDMVGAFSILESLYDLLYLVPSIALVVRRLHDTGHSGWWYLIALTGVGCILLLVWWCADSKPDNQYGPSPKGYAAMGYGPYGAPGTPGASSGYNYYGPQGNPQPPQDQGSNNYYNGPEL